jgi:hypothetical protein
VHVGIKLKISNKELMNNSGSCFLGAPYNLTNKQIYKKHSFVNIKGLTDEKTYQSFWSSISKTRCEKGNSLVHGLQSLWTDVEHALNKTLRELFVAVLDFYIQIKIDDD